MSSRSEARAELVRSRAFVRGAETQLTKALAALDAIDGEAPEEPAAPEQPEEPAEPEQPEVPAPVFSVFLVGRSLGWSAYPDATGYRVGFVSASGSQEQTVPASMTGVTIPDGSPAGQITVTVVTAAGDGPSASVGWAPPVEPEPEEPAPPAPPEPPIVLPPSGVAPVVAERFTYANTAALLNSGLYNHVENINTGRVALDTSVRYDGAPTMRYDQQAGKGTDHTIAMTLRLANLREMWAEVPVLLSDGWTINGNGQNGGASYKAIHVLVNPDEIGRFGLEWDNGDGGNSHMVAPTGGTDRETSYNVNALRGGWRVFRYHVRTGSGGIHEAWLDGRHLGSASSGTRATSLWGLRFGANLNKQPRVAQSLWWGRTLVYDRNPGW